MANSTIASRQKEAESVLKTYERGLVLVLLYNIEEVLSLEMHLWPGC